METESITRHCEETLKESTKQSYNDRRLLRRCFATPRNDVLTGHVVLSHISVCFLIVFLLSGCSKITSSLKTEDNTYKIAVAAPQIGPYKELGLSIVHGAELAVELKNQRGGINGKKIKLITVDDGGLAGEGTWRARSLVSEMVLGVIGHLNSDISIPASEIYAKAMIPEITPGSTSPMFTEREPVKGYVFRTIGRDDLQGKHAAKIVSEKGFKRIAVIYNNRGYGLSLSSEFLKSLGEASKDADIVFYTMYKIDNKDFSKEIAALKEKSSDLIFFVGEYGDAARFLKQLRQTGLKTAFLGSDGVFDQEFITTAKTASEGAWVISLPVVNNQTFIQSYKKLFETDVGGYSASTYDATSILISAIEKVKEDNSEKIAKAISETKNFSGLTGRISFDSKGDLVNPRFSIYEVKSGMFTAIH